RQFKQRSTRSSRSWGDDMGAGNGIVRINRKGLKKFAFGEDGPQFEVDVVVAYQHWIETDERFRPEQEDAEGYRLVPTESMPAYHQAAVKMVEELAGEAYYQKLTVAEALDFIARLREEYDDLVSFFRPRSRDERASPASSEGRSELRFSEEEVAAPN